MARPKKIKVLPAEEATTPPTPESTDDLDNMVAIPGITVPTATFISDADKREIDRYFCVIDNSEKASRIDQTITFNREFNVYGVHQFINHARNTYARSFYFGSKDIAGKAVAHAQALLST